jgi:hypothetical protein
MAGRLSRIVVVLVVATLLSLGMASALALASGEGTSAFAPSAGPWYVDDDTCPATGSGTQGDPYCRIQTAVDNADPGDEVLVATGLYTGSFQIQDVADYTHTQVVYIDKDLVLRGGFDPGDWTTADPTANPTTIDAERNGRCVTLRGFGYGHSTVSVTIDGFVLTGGDYTGLGNAPGVAAKECLEAGSDCGGGLYGRYATLTLRNSTITDNIASSATGDGGGAYIWSGARGTVIENTDFISNSAGLGWAGGLKAHDIYNPIRISGCEFRANVARGRAGAMLYSIRGALHIADTDFISNTALDWDVGGAEVRLSQTGGSLMMERVSFIGNEANVASAFLLRAAGAGTSPQVASIVNTLFAGNRAPAPDPDSAVFDVSGNFTDLDVRLVHVTAAGNDVPSFLYGKTGSDDDLTFTITNTLISSFDNAFLLEEYGTGEAYLHHTQLLASHVPTLYVTLVGTPSFSGVGTVTGDPVLDSRYRLMPGSAAIDKGVNAGVTDDIDRQVRPIGKPDIGADEWQLVVFTPLVLRDS